MSYLKYSMVSMIHFHETISLMTTTGAHNHVPEALKNNTCIVIIVKQRDGAKLGGCTAWIRDIIWVDQVYQGLHNSVICRVHVDSERERTVSSTVKGFVAIRGNQKLSHGKKKRGGRIKT